ncbi:hypothetical protein LCGC14_2405760 [marine sediment metagenome]|uniref:Uncharacterized protein n=1 Tax=marine sediment metagenome TaxID=412755 RepID=A0A0F9ENE3_9ZZZZ
MMQPDKVLLRYASQKQLVIYIRQLEKILHKMSTEHNHGCGPCIREAKRVLNTQL